MSTDNALEPLRAWPEIDAAIEELIRSRRAVNTRIAYTEDWSKWRAFVTSTGTDLATPGLGATTAFRDELTVNYAPNSIARILSSLSFFYGALRDAGLTRSNPFARSWLPRPQIGNLRRTPAVEEDVVTRIIEAIDRDVSWRGRRDAAVVHLLHETGLRRASIASLQRGALRREGDGLVAVVTVKGGHEHAVRIGTGGQQALDAWLAIAPPSPYVFPQERDPSNHVALATVNKILVTRSRQAGLLETASPHQFRAAFITTAYDAQLYERDIQVAAHHANAATTRGYDRGQRGDAVFERVAEHRKEKKSQ